MTTTRRKRQITSGCCSGLICCLVEVSSVASSPTTEGFDSSAAGKKDQADKTLYLKYHIFLYTRFKIKTATTKTGSLLFLERVASHEQVQNMTFEAWRNLITKIFS